MKVRKNKLKLLDNPDWHFMRNPDDCIFNTFRIIRSGAIEYLIGRDKEKDTNIIVAKKY